MATIREKIVLRIKELGIKQNDLSEKIGVNAQNLSSFLKGNRTIPFDRLEKLCMVLGLTLGDKNKVYNIKTDKLCSEKKSEEQ